MVGLIVALMFQAVSGTETYISDSAHRIKSYIEQNYREPITLDSIAARLHFSKQHIIRLFKKTYNLSPIKFLSQLRLEAALHHLRAGDTVNNIADQLHYSTPANFSMAFKKYYGLAPTDYLKMQHQDNLSSKKFLPPKK